MTLWGQSTCSLMRPGELNTAARKLVQGLGEVGTHLCPYRLPRTIALNSWDQEEGDPGVLGGSTIDA